MKPSARAALALVASVSIPAFAQQQAPAHSEKVEVTGSAIKRIDAETALPVQILTRTDIARTGATTTEDLLKQVTAITGFGGTLVQQSNGTITTSQSNISLRALGATRTLILVNGRRVAVLGGQNSLAVDVNTIPVAAIERIEVLKDGASSLYGSDAIAGVVNFILRKDFTGVELEGMYGEPTKSGGGKEGSVSAFAGIGDDRYNVSIAAGYRKVDEILGKDRSYAHNINVGANNDLSSTIAFPGNIVFGSSFTSLASPAFPDCGPNSIVSPFFIGNAASGRACRFENSPFLSVQPEQVNKFGMLNGRLRFSKDVEGYFESSYVRNEVTYTTQPVPIAENTALPSNNPYLPFIRNLIATQYPTLPAPLQRLAQQGTSLVLLPTTSPYYPTQFVASLGLPAGQPIAFRFRDFIQGLRRTEDSSDTYRVVGGLHGTAGKWDWDSAVLYSESKAKSDLLNGYALTSKFAELLDTGVINPFGPTTDPAAVAAAQQAQFIGTVYSSKVSITSIDAKGSRELFDLRGGAAAVAVGAEFRRETYDYHPSLAFQQGDVSGFGGNVFDMSASRHVTSVFAEFNAPLLKTLEANLGIRYDDYQGVGNTTNPKISMRWNPTQQLLVRGSYGTGFRAPSLTDLFQPQAASVAPNGSRDPIRCPNVATGSPADCNNQFPTITGGNPALKPEKSRQGTLGFILEPNPDVSLGLDGFWILLKDSIVIGGLTPAFLLQNADTATRFSSYILRGAPDGNASGVGPIVDILTVTSNLFQQKVQGFDVSGRWRVMKNEHGQVTLRLDGTYLTNFDQQNPDGSYTSGLDRALRAGGGIVPRWRHVAQVLYTNGPWDAVFQQNFQKNYLDQNNNIAPVVPRDVGSYETYDTQVAYSGIKSLRLALGVRNIFDRDPPYTNAGGQFVAGYDVTYADVRGRFVYGTATWRFR
jgi:iron complex outermembrane receptor protein